MKFPSFLTVFNKNSWGAKHFRTHLLFSHPLSRNQGTVAASNVETSPPLPPLFQIWGANTGVGKTVFSAGLLSTVVNPSLYIKPVQSGYPDDNDAATVESCAPNARHTTFYTYNDPLSPDLAARFAGGKPVSDEDIVRSTAQVLHTFFCSSVTTNSTSSAIGIIETAGGVLSPVPSGSLQADVYRQLRLPAVLVGDAQLGGVSTTLAGYEALRLRGYDVPVVVLFADRNGVLENEISIERHVDKTMTTVFQAPALPPMSTSLVEYFQGDPARSFFRNMLKHLHWAEQSRLSELDSMSDEAKRVFWYPFTQHKLLGDIQCFDSAHGDTIVAYDPHTKTHQKLTDAMGSWWTNGVGHGNVTVAKAIGAAAGRYGHVMFAEAASAPTLKLAKRLLEGPGAGWAARVFYSDNGSTAMEVALKMAMRKRAVDVPSRNHLPVKIVGLQGSYHGDTLGVMDCSEKSDFNRLQTPWYEERGMFFDAPIAGLRNGIWSVKQPGWLDQSYDLRMQSDSELFDLKRDILYYRNQISSRLDAVLRADEVDLAALVMEPVLQGAGGMRLIDPAFQRALVIECRNRRIPIILDEVFTGLWRLGHISGGRLLGVEPDIAAYGKLLTGGTVPLSATLASESVMRAFDGASKREALLHGHSYTAHAIGCAAAVESLRQYEITLENPDSKKIYWDDGFAREISTMNEVERVTLIGTVFAVEMKSKQRGYGATGAQELVKRLLCKGIYARPLGNVVYMMCSPVSNESVCTNMTKSLVSALQSLKEQTTEDSRRFG